LWHFPVNLSKNQCGHFEGGVLSIEVALMGTQIGVLCHRLRINTAAACEIRRDYLPGVRSNCGFINVVDQADDAAFSAWYAWTLGKYSCRLSKLSGGQTLSIS
jgi:hypothetical protein